jgi:hypothetical protein
VIENTRPVKVIIDPAIADSTERAPSAPLLITNGSWMEY